MEKKEAIKHVDEASGEDNVREWDRIIGRIIMSSKFVSKQGIAKDSSYSVLLDDGKTHLYKLARERDSNDRYSYGLIHIRQWRVWMVQLLFGCSGWQRNPVGRYLEAKGVFQYDDNEEDENWGNSCSELTGN